MPGEHKHIIDAIISASAEAARAAMQTHMEKFCKNLLEMETAYRRRALMAV
jgi:DNA-binding GntR family transcriptional regulator